MGRDWNTELDGDDRDTDRGAGKQHNAELAALDAALEYTGSESERRVYFFEADDIETSVRSVLYNEAQDSDLTILAQTRSAFAWAYLVLQYSGTEKEREREGRSVHLYWLSVDDMDRDQPVLAVRSAKVYTPVIRDKRRPPTLISHAQSRDSRDRVRGAVDTHSDTPTSTATLDMDPTGTSFVVSLSLLVERDRQREWEYASVLVHLVQGQLEVCRPRDKKARMPDRMRKHSATAWVGTAYGEVYCLAPSKQPSKLEVLKVYPVLSPREREREREKEREHEKDSEKEKERERDRLRSRPCCPAVIAITPFDAPEADQCEGVTRALLLLVGHAGSLSVLVFKPNTKQIHGNLVSGIKAAMFPPCMVYGERELGTGALKTTPPDTFMSLTCPDVDMRLGERTFRCVYVYPYASPETKSKGRRERDRGREGEREQWSSGSTVRQHASVAEIDVEGLAFLPSLPKDGDSLVNTMLSSDTAKVDTYPLAEVLGTSQPVTGVFSAPYHNLYLTRDAAYPVSNVNKRATSFRVGYDNLDSADDESDLNGEFSPPTHFAAIEIEKEKEREMERSEYTEGDRDAEEPVVQDIKADPGYVSLGHSICTDSMGYATLQVNTPSGVRLYR
ncbi:hypothetical protein KIPB_008981 [Kipferlia bialata]|uniref:Uncharacterized protein n=1 Tax=Kipferlia bialata TaxID=797122 RepID=A0A9K3D3A2_9EUKA|nr:hypothetical protein KIPB_008981 [Kipferlia bialata]|eukprot:g8981.t1